ncbi:MAG: MFS transporter [Erythrobacter sp.]|jgi:MFS family permease
MTLAAPARSARSFPLFILGLATTQILGWGTTLYLPSILDRQISADLGVGRNVIYGGITVMLFIAALVGPRFGRWIDEGGARHPMLIGKLLLAAGLVGIGLSTGPLGYLAAWVLIGIGTPLSLSIGSLASVTQSFPERGRRGLRALMLFGGLSNGLIWPLTGWLETEIGWRNVCFVYAAVQVLVCLPLAHVLIRAPVVLDDADPAAPKVATGQLSEAQRRQGFWLLILAAGFSGLVSWGLPLFFVAMFLQGGMEAGMAIFLASVTAYFTFLARIIDFALSGKVPGVRIVAGASLMSPLVFVLMLLALGTLPPGLSQTTLLALAMGLYGVATGLIATSRATLPFELFGSGGYASMLGKLSFFLNMLFAASPLLFAMIYDGLGKQAAIVGGLAGSLVAAIAYIRLERLVCGKSAA